MRTTLTETEIAELSRSGSRLSPKAGEVIFQRFDDGDCMYIVESGSVELQFENGRPRKEIGPTGFFGELALLFGSHQRSATAVALSDCQLWALNQSHFDHLMDNQPRLLFSVLQRSCAALLESERALARYLTRRNLELARTLDRLRSTEQRLTTAEIAAQTDPLTDLFNRRLLESEVAHYLERAEQTDSGLALVLLDLDDFKQINDRHGHAVGDDALKTLAERLRGNLRRTDLACRIGGDEFAVLLVEIQDVEAEARVAALFRRVGKYQIPTTDGAVRITASLGGVTYRSGEDWESFFERADANLYSAKDAGRNRLSWNGRVLDV